MIRYCKLHMFEDSVCKMKINLKGVCEILNINWIILSLNLTSNGFFNNLS